MFRPEGQGQVRCGRLDVMKARCVVRPRSICRGGGARSRRRSPAARCRRRWSGRGRRELRARRGRRRRDHDQPGQFVIGSFFVSDGTCPNCQAGYPSSCQHREFVGGAQAELLRVPLADGTLVATPDVPDDTQLPSLLALSDVMATGWWAMVAADVQFGDTSGRGPHPGRECPVLRHVVGGSRHDPPRPRRAGQPPC